MRIDLQEWRLPFVVWSLGMVPIVALYFILNDGWWPWENLCASDLAPHYIECLKDPRPTPARPPAPQATFGLDKADDLQNILQNWDFRHEPPRVDRSKVLLRHQTQVYYNTARMIRNFGMAWTTVVLMLYTRLKELFLDGQDAKE
jgi:hypothetical protein